MPESNVLHRALPWLWLAAVMAAYLVQFRELAVPIVVTLGLG